MKGLILATTDLRPPFDRQNTSDPGDDSDGGKLMVSSSLHRLSRGARGRTVVEVKVDSVGPALRMSVLPVLKDELLPGVEEEPELDPVEPVLEEVKVEEGSELDPVEPVLEEKVKVEEGSELDSVESKEVEEVNPVEDSTGRNGTNGGR